MNIFPGDTPSWEKWIVKRCVSLHRPSHEPRVVKMTGAAEIPFVFPPFVLEENLRFFRGHKSQTTPCFTMVKHHVSPSSIRGFHTRHVFSHHFTKARQSSSGLGVRPCGNTNHRMILENSDLLICTQVLPDVERSSAEFNIQNPPKKNGKIRTPYASLIGERYISQNMLLLD